MTRYGRCVSRCLTSEQLRKELYWAIVAGVYERDRIKREPRVSADGYYSTIRMLGLCLKLPREAERSRY
jgi:hypothetical protein